MWHLMMMCDVMKSREGISLPPSHLAGEMGPQRPWVKRWVVVVVWVGPGGQRWGFAQPVAPGPNPPQRKKTLVSSRSPQMSASFALTILRLLEGRPGVLVSGSVRLPPAGPVSVSALGL